MISEKSSTLFAKGEPSFNPQPAARNFTKPPLMLRLGTNRRSPHLIHTSITCKERDVTDSIQAALERS